MSIDPRHLRIFLAACRAGTLTGAARDLSMAQPSVSVSLSLLERSLGTKLFDRSRSGITLNPAGEALRLRAIAMEHLIEDAERSVLLAGRQLRGPLTLGGTPGALASLMPSVMPKLRALDRGFEASIFERSEEMLTTMLRDGRIEFAIVTAGMASVAEDIVEQPVLEDTFALIVGPDHPEIVDGVSLNELADAHWVLPQAIGGFRRQVDAVFIASGSATPLDVVRCDSLLTTKALVHKSGYLTILPLAVASAEVEAGLLRAVDIAGIDVTRSVGIRWSRDHALSDLGRDFLGACGVDVAQGNDVSG